VSAAAVVPVLLALLAPLIWLAERGWMAQAADCLPLFVALPLFVLLGRPWTLLPPRRPPRLWVYALAVGLIVAGEPSGLIVLMAAGWTLALWEWLEPRLAAERVPAIRRLLVLPMLAFPWIIVDGEGLGWLFRLSGAWVTAGTFALLGFDVRQQGTGLIIDGQRVEVAAACSGLNTLQALLVCGTFVAYGVLGRTARYWWALPILVITAWIANTLRIIMLSAAIIVVSERFAMGAFHDVGGLAVLLLMVVLCFLLLPLLRPRSANAPSAPSAPSTSVAPAALGASDAVIASTPLATVADLPVAGATVPPSSTEDRWTLPAQLAVVAVTAVLGGSLLKAWLWEVSPFDRWGWLAALVWLVPLVLHLRCRDQHRPSAVWASFAGLAIALAGALGDNNPLCHLGLTLSIAALLPWQPWWPWWLWWVAGAGAWWPATGVLILHRIDLPIAWALGFRLTAAVAAVLPMAIITWRRRTLVMPVVAAPVAVAVAPGSRRWRGLLWASLVATIALVVLWRFVELPDAQDRVRRLPLNGPGFSGRDQPLAAAEATIFGSAQAIKRRYLVDGRPLELMVIDGTRNRHAVHDPLYCKLGAGWQVSGRRAIAVPGGSADLVTIAKDGLSIELMYWFSDGVVRHASPLHYWGQATWRRLTLGAGGAEPVLVIVSPLSLRSPRWDRLFADLPGLGGL